MEKLKREIRKDPEKMTEHELRTEVLKLRAKVNRLKKREVPEEFVVKWINTIKDCIVFNDKNETIRSFIKMLKEAGVRVA